ncbi:taste receptor type 2 member 13 [Xenopus laevis]|uniref:Taste receptor type 2 n=2 Tax=Xenopus laevis TaxID=8355 RepID=A0A974CZC2_XENLA|nr:taste receptor type 2 member 13 [Xenopus laevis]OCT81565.1 hypothetical protein XELAEV_18028388mg [Xenopus laevis]
MDLALQVIVLFQFFLGITVNGFIVGVFFTQWITGGNLNTIDTILIVVGLMRFLWHWVISLTNLLPDIELPVSATFISFISSLLNWNSFGLVSVLYVTYCVKISNYNNAVFLYIKLRISKTLKWLTVATLVINLAYSVISVPWDVVLSHQNNSDILLGNSPFIITGITTDYSFVLFCIVFSISFVIRLASMLALIHSLRRHMQQIQCSGTPIQNPHLAAHLRVIKVLILFLSLYIMYFTSLIIGSLDKYKTKRLSIPYVIILCFYPSVHSGVLIFSNRKLRKAGLAMYHRSINCAKTRKPNTQIQNTV